MIERIKDSYVKTATKHVENQAKEPSNISKNAVEGMKKLRKRINDGEMIVTNSDKSKKTVVMPKDSYMREISKHTKNDKGIDWKRVKQVEK